MPTTRPRHQITETPDVARALDLAARHWPGEPRGKLLVRLVEVGTTALEDERAETLRRRRAAVAETSGKYTGVFTDGYLEELRQDWPE